MAHDRRSLMETLLEAVVGDSTLSHWKRETVSRIDSNGLTPTRELPTPLLEFLDGLSAISKKAFPEGGMLVSDFEVNDGVASQQMPEAVTSPAELVDFFACVIGDTTVTRPADAEATVANFLDVIHSSYPEGKIHFRLHDSHGWPSQLETWIVAPNSYAYFCLVWSVS